VASRPQPYHARGHRQEPGDELEPERGSLRRLGRREARANLPGLGGVGEIEAEGDHEDEHAGADQGDPRRARAAQAGSDGHHAHKDRDRDQCERVLLAPGGVASVGQIRVRKVAAGGRVDLDREERRDLREHEQESGCDPERQDQRPERPATPETRVESGNSSARVSDRFRVVPKAFHGRMETPTT
jgi:hypothetical protein